MKKIVIFCLIVALILTCGFVGYTIRNEYITGNQLKQLIFSQYHIPPSEVKYQLEPAVFLSVNQALSYINEASIFFMKKNNPYIKPENIRFEDWISTIKQQKNWFIKQSDINVGIGIIKKTEDYIAETSLDKFEKQGTDFHNVKFSPERLGKPYDEINPTYDYDFGRLKKVEDRLSNVDRGRVLKSFFYSLSKKAQNNTEIYMRIFKFLSKSSFHNPLLQPMYPDKTMVTDPLVLLELGEMRCGQVSRLAIDIFQAGGYKGRLVQAGGHILAELYFDNEWHYFDANFFGGDSVATFNGKIPSMVKLSQQPYFIDTLASYVETNAYVDRIQNTNLPYPSYYYFSKKAYAQNTNAYYIKTATDTDTLNKYYGWNHYDIVQDKERILYTMDPYYKPLSVKYKSITEVSVGNKENYTLQWYPTYDGDNDLEGYRVFVSDKSRGWAFESFYGDKGLEKYRAHIEGYSPTMYDKMFQLPVGNIQTITTMNTTVNISVPTGTTYYITVTPFDKHGEKIGNQYNLRSNELKLTNN